MIQSHGQNLKRVSMNVRNGNVLKRLPISVKSMPKVGLMALLIPFPIHHMTVSVTPIGCPKRTGWKISTGSTLILWDI